VSIPIIGVGGISSADDVIEFLLAGATAVQVGTATFTRPDTMIRIIDDLEAHLAKDGIASVAELVGQLETGASRHDLVEASASG
jgi:dihydroorotate dehydrogenase (NAD+) catalytic subunit